jgi:hypothetical protein
MNSIDEAMEREVEGVAVQYLNTLLKYAKQSRETAINTEEEGNLQQQ